MAREHEASVTELVQSAASGNQRAWDELVDRYTPLIMSVVSQHRLGEADGADVGQTVWLQLVQHLGGLREPAALPGWIRTTARNECLRVIRARRQTSLSDLGDLPSDEPEVDADLVRAERHAALLAGFAELPASQRELLRLLVVDPPLSYAEISERLGISRGSIGPTRARALERLREFTALASLSLLDPKEGETRGITAH